MIDRLMLFGLSRQEAVIYTCLYQNGALSGYEAAKLTGISRSNVYSALSGLVEKGAAYLMEGATNKYVAVPPGELCDNRLRMLQEAKEYLEDHLQSAAEEEDGYITIEGNRNIDNKIRTMLQSAEKRIYISLPYRFLSAWEAQLLELAGRGIKVVVLTDCQVQLAQIQVYVLQQDHPQQIHLIVDSRYVLTGDYSGAVQDACLYSGQKNFVNVLKQALRNEIRLIELSCRNDEEHTVISNIKEEQIEGGKKWQSESVF